MIGSVGDKISPLAGKELRLLTSSCPFMAHMWSGVLPSLSIELISEPKCTNNSCKQIITVK